MSKIKMTAMNGDLISIDPDEVLHRWDTTTVGLRVITFFTETHIVQMQTEVEVEMSINMSTIRKSSRYPNTFREDVGWVYASKDLKSRLAVTPIPPTSLRVWQTLNVEHLETWSIAVELLGAFRYVDYLGAGHFNTVGSPLEESYSAKEHSFLLIKGNKRS